MALWVKKKPFLNCYGGVAPGNAPPVGFDFCSPGTACADAAGLIARVPWRFPARRAVCSSVAKLDCKAALPAARHAAAKMSRISCVRSITRQSVPLQIAQLRGSQIAIENNQRRFCEAAPRFSLPQFCRDMTVAGSILSRI